MYAANEWPNGDRISPFMGWQSGSASSAGQLKTKEAPLAAQAQHDQEASDVVMIVEVADQNWWHQVDTLKYGKATQCPRTGARHSKQHGTDGIYAWTNFAFFDGHVGF